MSLFFQSNNGYYSIKPLGIILIAALIFIFLVIPSLFLEEKPNKRFSTKKLAFSALAIALGFITSFIEPVHMPWGGGITLCSMFCICLVGYWYGLEAGLFASFAYSLLQFLHSGCTFILSPLQVCFDYFLAFTALGLSGLFRNKKNGLVHGYLLAVLVRGVFHTLGGYIYWMDYMPDNFPKTIAFLYPILYNYAYLIPEALLTVFIISLPNVKAGLEKVRQLAADNKYI